MLNTGISTKKEMAAVVHSRFPIFTTSELRHFSVLVLSKEHAKHIEEQKNSAFHNANSCRQHLPRELSFSETNSSRGAGQDGPQSSKGESTAGAGAEHVTVIPDGTSALRLAMDMLDGNLGEGRHTTPLPPKVNTR